MAGILSAPVVLRRLMIALGERYEVLVDFTDGTDLVLATGPDQNMPMMGMMGGGAAAAGGDVMKVQVNPAIAAAVTALPKKLIDVPFLDHSQVVVST